MRLLSSALVRYSLSHYLSMAVSSAPRPFGRFVLSGYSIKEGLSDKTDSLYEFGLSGFRFQRQAGHFAVQTHIV